MNPWLTALLGAMAFLVLGVAAVQTTAQRLVDRLHAAAESTLAGNGLDWASVDMDGQTAILSGVAPSAAAQAEARDLVIAADGVGGPLWGGVILVDDRTTLATTGAMTGAPDQGPFVWRAVKVGSTVQMTGSVPNAVTRTALVEKARALFPNNVVDRMSVSEGAPDGDWRAAAETALDALASLRTGEARISDTTLVVSGNADDATVAGAVKDAVRQPAVGFSGTSEAVVVAGGPPDQAGGDRAGARGAAADDDRNVATPGFPAAPDDAAGAPVDGNGLPAAATDGGEACQKRLDALVSGLDILFEFGSTRIDGESLTVIDRVAKVLLSCPDVRLLVAGHSDDQGSEAVNRRISLNRANSVIDRLAEVGVDRDRLTARAYGSSQPVAGNDSDDGRRQNRRIELKVLQ